MAVPNRSGRTLVLTLLMLSIFLVGGGGYYWMIYRNGPTALRHRIRALMKEGDNRRAVPMLRELVKYHPREVRIRHSLADNLRTVARQARPGAIDPPEAVDQLLVAVQLDARRDDLLTRLFSDFRQMSRSEMSELQHEKFRKMTPEQAAGEIGVRLLMIDRADADTTAFAVRHAVDTGDIEFLKSIAERLDGDDPENQVVRLAMNVKIHEAEGKTERIYWEVEPAVSRLLNTSSIQLQALNAQHLPFLGMVLEGAVRYAPTGAEADHRLLQAVSLVRRIASGELGETHHLELVELTARPVSAALRSRVREGLDVDATPEERRSPETRHRALEMFVEFAEPVFGMGIVSPFVYEQLSRAALELENDRQAISFLKRGIRQYSQLEPENRNELMAVHAQAAMRLISRGQFEPLREDVVSLKRHEHTRELGALLEGLLAFQQGRFEDAHEHLDDIPDQSPHRVAASGLLVRVLLVQKQWEEALAILEDIDDRWLKLPEVTRHWLVEATGSRDRLRLLRACCLQKLGRTQPAAELLSYLDGTSQSAGSRLIRAIELMRSGSDTRVWEVLREARGENPDNFDLLLAEFGMLVREEALDGARRLLEGFVREHPEQPRAGLAYATWLRDQGKSSKALDVLTSVRPQAPETLLVWLLSADLMRIERRYSELGQLVAEMQQYPAAVPHIPVIHAYVLLRNEELDGAADALLDAGFETWHSNGYTTVEAMTSLPKDDARLAYEQFARSFRISPIAAGDRHRLLNQIGQALANIDPAAISVHIDQVLEEYPAEPVLLLAGIELALRRGAFETASDHIDTLERVDAVPGRAHYMRARMHSASGLNNRALDELKKALEEAPSYASARLMSARLEYSGREYERALVEVRQLTWPMSDSEEAVLLEARTLAKLDRSDEAIDRLTARVQKTPHRVEPWLALSQVYAAFNRPDMAKAVVEQALQYHPRATSLQDELLELHVQSGSTETAAALAKSFGGPSPDIGHSIRFARKFLENGEPEVAADWIGRAHMAPSSQANHELIFLDALLIHERGTRSGKLHLLQAARRRYEDLLARQPGHIAALNGLARLLMRDMNLVAEGVAIVEQIRSQTPLDRLEPDVQATVAEAYRRSGKPTEALTVIKRCINQHPDAAALRIEHAAILLEGFPEDPVKAKLAKKELERAAELRVPANRRGDYAAVSARLNEV